MKPTATKSRIKTQVIITAILFITALILGAWFQTSGHPTQVLKFFGPKTGMTLYESVHDNPLAHRQVRFTGTQLLTCPQSINSSCPPGKRYEYTTATDKDGKFSVPNAYIQDFNIVAVYDAASSQYVRHVQFDKQGLVPDDSEQGRVGFAPDSPMARNAK